MKTIKKYIAVGAKTHFAVGIGGKKINFDVPTPSDIGLMFITDCENTQKLIEGSKYFNRGIRLHKTLEVAETKTKQPDKVQKPDVQNNDTPELTRGDVIKKLDAIGAKYNLKASTDDLVKLLTESEK